MIGVSNSHTLPLPLPRLYHYKKLQRACTSTSLSSFTAFQSCTFNNFSDYHFVVSHLNLYLHVRRSTFYTYNIEKKLAYPNFSGFRTVMFNSHSFRKIHILNDKLEFYFWVFFFFCFGGFLCFFMFCICK